jgi:hypothetical protein
MSEQHNGQLFGWHMVNFSLDIYSGVHRMTNLIPIRYDRDKIGEEKITRRIPL